MDAASELGLCVGPDIEYSVLKDLSDDSIYVMASALIERIYKKADAYEVLRTLPGSELLGATYEPLFPYFADHANSFQILNDGYVSTDSGTGIVHQAPAYGEDDYRVCTNVGIELIDPG